MGDPTVFGLDAAFPAGLLALILPALREAAAPRVASSARPSPCATPFLPAGLPVLLALIGLVAAGPPRPALVVPG